MPVRPDVVAVVPDPSKRWTFPGGEEDDDSITLTIVAVDGAKRRTFRVGLAVMVDDELTVNVNVRDVEEVPR